MFLGSTKNITRVKLFKTERYMDGRREGWTGRGVYVCVFIYVRSILLCGILYVWGLPLSLLKKNVFPPSVLHPFNFVCFTWKNNGSEILITRIIGFSHVLFSRCGLRVLHSVLSPLRTSGSYSRGVGSKHWG